MSSAAAEINYSCVLNAKMSFLKKKKNKKKPSTFWSRNPRLGDISYKLRMFGLTFLGSCFPGVKQECHLLLWKLLWEGESIYIHKSLGKHIEKPQRNAISEALFNAALGQLLKGSFSRPHTLCEEWKKILCKSPQDDMRASEEGRKS